MGNLLPRVVRGGWLGGPGGAKVEDEVCVSGDVPIF